MNNTVGQNTSGVNVSRGICRGELIPREQLIACLGVSPNTILKWEAAGLPVYSPGTKSKYYDTCEVIEFIKRFCTQ